VSHCASVWFRVKHFFSGLDCFLASSFQAEYKFITSNSNWSCLSLEIAPPPSSSSSSSLPLWFNFSTQMHIFGLLDRSCVKIKLILCLYSTLFLHPVQGFLNDFPDNSIGVHASNNLTQGIIEYTYAVTGCLAKVMAQWIVYWTLDQGSLAQFPT